MMFWIVAVVCVSRSCMAVTVNIDGKEVDCSYNCVCCKGGTSKCRFDNRCTEGCVETIYGQRCHNPCPENCYTCEYNHGKICYTCKDLFYDKNSSCSKRCSVGCHDGTCNDDGKCIQCKTDFEGPRCEQCLPGKYGSDCVLTCAKKNCRCTTDKECISCKKGFYGSSTSCQTLCSIGCQNGTCNDDGTCYCTSGFNGTTCNECIPGYHGTHCEKLCSLGCVKRQCSTDGTCSCRDNFKGTTCDTCADGRYGDYCDQVCSVGCNKTMACDRNNGSCECLPNFTGDKCEQCLGGLYGHSCDLHCPYTCKAGTCSQYEGICTHGCVAGYSGDNCTTHCDKTCATCLQSDTTHCESCYNGYTGSNCQCPPNCKCAFGFDICVSCKQGYESPEQQCTCQSKYCIDSGCDQCINQTFYADNKTCCDCPENCKNGTCKSGPECIFGCIDGFYGLDCSQSCLSLNVDCSRCTQTNGKCLECNDGFYSNDSGSCISCSINCKSGHCNSGTGACINGCNDRFWGDKCDFQCGPNCEICQLDSGICSSCTDTTFHGLSCNESCSASCFESKCEHRSGYCSNGCSRDSFGRMCDIKCPENCQQGATETSCNIVGDCLYGCINGLEGRDCSERRIYIGSSTISALAATSGVLGILLIGTAPGCYLWYRQRSKPTEEEDQSETEMTYEQLPGQTNEQTYTNVDENYSVLSM